jgi:hypothetical protein
MQRGVALGGRQGRVARECHAPRGRVTAGGWIPARPVAHAGAVRRPTGIGRCGMIGDGATAQNGRAPVAPRQRKELKPCRRKVQSTTVPGTGGGIHTSFQPGPACSEDLSGLRLAALNMDPGGIRAPREIVGGPDSCSARSMALLALPHSLAAWREAARWWCQRRATPRFSASDESGARCANAVGYGGAGGEIPLAPS